MPQLEQKAGKRFGAARYELTHDQKVALKTDFDRVRRYFELDFERNGAQPTALPGSRRRPSGG